MNLGDILISVLPISSAVFGLVAAICSSVLTKQIEKKMKEELKDKIKDRIKDRIKDNTKIVIKLDDRQIEIVGEDKEELIEKLSQIICEKKLSSLKTEDAINKEKPSEYGVSIKSGQEE